MCNGHSGVCVPQPGEESVDSKVRRMFIFNTCCMSEKKMLYCRFTVGVTVSTIQQGINVNCVRQVSTTDPGEQAQ